MAEDTDSNVIKTPTMSDFHRAAEALIRVLQLKYAICG
jgi:hypothetical protein